MGGGRLAPAVASHAASLPAEAGNPVLPGADGGQGASLLGIHPRQQTRRDAVHRRDERSHPPRVRTPHGRRARLHQEVSGAPTRLLRAIFRYRECDPTREAAQEMESRLENSADRAFKSELGRPLSVYCDPMSLLDCPLSRAMTVESTATHCVMPHESGASSTPCPHR